LPEAQQTEAVMKLLADLGANHEAFQIAARIATTREYPGPSILWSPSMREVLSDPGFPALARQLGLVKYWQTTRTKPDVCNGESAPAFCCARDQRLAPVRDQNLALARSDPRLGCG
jgi:hypothetical protein